MAFYRIKIRLEARLHRLRRKAERRWPSLVNEGEATTIVASNLVFDGYPMAEDYNTLEEAVDHLQRLWSTLDDWDGSRINVYRAQYGFDGGHKKYKEHRRRQTVYARIQNKLIPKVLRGGR